MAMLTSLFSGNNLSVNIRSDTSTKLRMKFPSI